jgi:hypothetical protein
MTTETSTVTNSKGSSQSPSVLTITHIAVAVLGAAGLIIIIIMSPSGGKGLSGGHPDLVCQTDSDCREGMVCLGYHGSEYKKCAITCVDWDGHKDCPDGMACAIEVDGAEAGNKGICSPYEYPDKKSAVMAFMRVGFTDPMDELQCEIKKDHTRPVVYCRERHDCPSGMSCLEYHDLPYRTCEFVCSLWRGRCPTDMACFANKHVILPYVRGTCEPVICRKAP